MLLVWNLDKDSHSNVLKGLKIPNSSVRIRMAPFRQYNMYGAVAQLDRAVKKGALSKALAAILHMEVTSQVAGSNPAGSAIIYFIMYKNHGAVAQMGRAVKKGL